MTSRDFRIGSQTSGRALALLSLALSVTILSGCGDTVTKPEKVDPTPTPVKTEEIGHGSQSNLEPFMLLFVPFHNSQAGTIDAIVDWTFTTNDVDAYLVPNTCTFEQFVAGQCQVLAFSESASAKPEKITALNAPVGDYYLLVGNLGPTTESVSFQVLITTGGSASSAAVGQARPAFAKGIPAQAVRLR